MGKPHGLPQGAEVLLDLVSAKAVFEAYNTPSYDLDNKSQGFEARLEQELPAGLKIEGGCSRMETAYSKRIIFNPPPCPPFWPPPPGA